MDVKSFKKEKNTFQKKMQMYNEWKKMTLGQKRDAYGYFTDDHIVEKCFKCNCPIEFLELVVRKPADTRGNIGVTLASKMLEVFVKSKAGNVLYHKYEKLLMKYIIGHKVYQYPTQTGWYLTMMDSNIRAANIEKAIEYFVYDIMPDSVPSEIPLLSVPNSRLNQDKAQYVASWISIYPDKAKNCDSYKDVLAFIRIEDDDENIGIKYPF